LLISYLSNPLGGHATYSEIADFKTFREQVPFGGFVILEFRNENGGKNGTQITAL
jgi:hypothetical protein